MPPPIIHIAIAIMLCFVFIFGAIFPDLDKTIHKDFWRKKCYRGFFKDQMQCCDIPRGFLHNPYFWVGMLVFSLGCLLHIVMDNFQLRVV